MNKLYFFFILCLSIESAQADWNLFPLNQKSYYSIPYSGQERISLVAFDTIIQRTGFHSAFTNRKFAGNGLEFCYAEVTDFVLYSTPFNMEFDSLVFSGDTVFFSSQLYFLPNKSLGESWRISGLLQNGFTDIEFTCTSVSVQSFLGLTDTVKEYTVSTYNGASLYNSPLSGFVLKLSKNYGLLDYLEFANLQNHSREERHIIGMSDSSGSFGFQAPTYLEFFPYKVGDVLNWLTETHPWFPNPYTYFYFRDSIISLSISPDTLKYRCIRQGFRLPSGIHSVDTIEEYVMVDYFKSIMEMPPNWFSINPRTTFSGVDISLSDYFNVDQDSSLSYIIYYAGHFVDTNNCQTYQVADVFDHYKYNNKQGLIEYCYNAFYYDCTTRTGSYMDGVLYGDTTFVTGIGSVSFDSFIKMYPNPAQNKLCISFSGESAQKSSIEIMNISGSILYSEIREFSIFPCSIELDLNNFENGFYVLSVKNAGGESVARGKFVVQR